MGFSAIGSAVLGATGLFGGAAAGALATTIAGVVTSAVVGAAIGGLSAAVMGGDIGKGMLFGAVGGVVTGGIAGGAIVNTMAPTALQEVGTVGILEGTTGTMAGTGSGAFQAMTPVATEAAGGAALFGGALDITAPGLVGQAMDFITGGLQPEAQEDWGKTEDFWRAKWEHEDAQNARAVAASSRNASGSTVPYLELEALKGKNALQQIAAESAEQRKLTQLQGEQGMAQQKQEYSLANKNAEAEWNRGMEKLYDAAGAAASSKYQSGEGAYEAVLTAEQAAGNTAQSRGVLAGANGEGA